MAAARLAGGATTVTGNTSVAAAARLASPAQMQALQLQAIVQQAQMSGAIRRAQTAAFWQQARQREAHIRALREVREREQAQRVAAKQAKAARTDAQLLAAN